MASLEVCIAVFFRSLKAHAQLCAPLIVNRYLTVLFFCCFQLEGRKISSSQFLKVLSTLRVWEICAPDINAAIEVTFFVP